VMFRHAFRRALASVERGADPVGVSRGPDTVTYTVRAGNYIGQRDEVIGLG
jgi:Tfp pilus assembly protein PilP